MRRATSRRPTRRPPPRRRDNARHDYHQLSLDQARKPHASPLDWGVKLNVDLDLIDAKVYALDQGYNAANALFLNKTTVAAGNPIYGQLNGVTRWVVEVGEGTAETGANAGSNFSIYRYNDAGAYVDAPFTIYRATGQANFAYQLNVAAVLGCAMTAFCLERPRRA